MTKTVPSYVRVKAKGMIYTTIDMFYLTDEQLANSPSKKDGIDEATETTLRMYGCDLIQESGIFLRLPQAVMATGQVLFHRFYCKKSFARFNVKASKLEENHRNARQVINFLSQDGMQEGEFSHGAFRLVFQEMRFICHVEHPHKFISNYLATSKTPPELRQQAWNLANDNLRTTLCVRFKSRFQVPIPENPPWWMAFDGENSGIDEVYAWFWVTFIAFQSHNIYQSARMGTLHFPTNHQKQSLNQQIIKKSFPSFIPQFK
ncbi:Cyclin-L1-1 [Glycine max]|nr:Cyclin-L1-1 [Glycine max]